MQKFREEADYAEGYVSDEGGTRRDLAEASALVDAIEKQLAKAS